MKADSLDENYGHRPFVDENGRFKRIKDGARLFAELIDTTAPESEEKTLSLRKVQEAVHWAHTAMAVNEGQV